MPPSLKDLGIDQLTVDERIALAQEIWDSISPATGGPLMDAQKQELDRRIAAHEADPDATVPWETVKGEAVARMQR